MGGIQFGIYSLPDTIAEINNLVTQISTGLTGLESNLSTQIAGIKPAVKSVQRGVLIGGVAQQDGNDVAISAINVSKSFVLVEVYTVLRDITTGVLGAIYDKGATGAILNETTIRVSCPGAYFGEDKAVTWQVVEYN